MKKILILLLVLFLYSCEEEPKTYRVQVEVHYPEKTDTLVFENQFIYYPKVSSYEGSNKIHYDGFGTIIETTAPINIIHIEEIK